MRTIPQIIHGIIIPENNYLRKSKKGCYFTHRINVTQHFTINQIKFESLMC